MSVTRIGAIFQPAGMRALSIFADTSSNLPARLRWFFEQIVVASEAALNVLPALLTPAAVTALVLGLWRVSADLGWTEDFIIANGFFSHWQVWMALAGVLQIAAASLAARISNGRV
ncbi:MAG TPA: hypothetical protein VNX70_08700 [Bryobacteraceae bacterium]|nr:hypothetical protein [Bryobacteraceae bacterium]